MELKQTNNEESHTKTYVFYFLIFIVAVVLLMIVMGENRNLKKYSRELLVNNTILENILIIQASSWNDTLNQCIKFEADCQNIATKYWQENIDLTQQLLQCRFG